MFATTRDTKSLWKDLRTIAGSDETLERVLVSLGVRDGPLSVDDVLPALVAERRRLDPAAAACPQFTVRLPVAG